jgi:proteasome lid subunit RPN8/RPN11
MSVLDEIADEVFPAKQPELASATPRAAGSASVLDEVADEVFEGKPPKEPEPGILSRAASAVTSAVREGVSATPLGRALGFKPTGPAVAEGAAAPPKDVALPQVPTPDALKATGRSASVIPEPVAPPPPVPVKLGPVPGLEAVTAEAQKAPLLERVSGAAPGSPLPVPERPAPGGMLGRAAAKAGIVDPEAAKRRAAEAEFAATSVMTKPEGVDPVWWQVQQGIKQANRTLDAMPKEFVNRLLFGIPNAIKDTFGFDSPQARAPQSTAEAITGGTGDLAGFIVGPAKVAHAMLATNITKALAPQAGNALGTIMAKSIANEAATLAVASGLAHAGDVTQADSLKEAFHQLGEHVKGGAVLGATFGGLGNVIPANTLTQRAARLGVGLGILDVVQGTSITDDRALAQKVYDYGLNIYFLWKGKDPRAIKAALEAAAAARSKPGAAVTPEQVLKSVLDKAMERADKMKTAEPELPGAPAPDRSAELSALLSEELAAATAPLKSAAEVVVEKTGGPVTQRPVADLAPEVVLTAGARPAPRPAAPPARFVLPVPGVPAGPVRILGPTGRPAEAPPAPVAPEVPAPALKSAQELAEERMKGIRRPATPAPQAPPAAVAAKAVDDRPTTSLSFKDYVELSGKKWPLTSREPDYARLRFEFDDMKKGLYEARPVGDGRWAVINRKTGEEVDHLPSGAKAQLESNRLNSVVTLDAWRNAQIPAPIRMTLPERPKADLAAKPAPDPKVEPGSAAAQQKEAEAELTGPKPSAEPPAPAKAQAPPASSVLVGKTQEIRVPAGSKYQIRYEVVEADSMIPSHDPRTFAKDQRYPEGVQNRPYHSDKSEQAKVIRQGQDFEPLFLVSPQPSSGGTPIVAPDSNVVLSGNSRTMSLLRTRGTEAYDRYRAALAEMAPALGVKAEDLAKVQNPVLVRRLVGTDTTPEFYRRFAKETNEGFKQALNTQAAAVSQGAAMKPETMEWIAGAVDSLGENATLRDFLRSGRDREIIRRFIQDGVFTDRDLNRFIDPKTTQLNEDGKRLVERAILGNAIPDPDLLSQAPASIVAKIERSLGALAKTKGRGEGWDLGKDLEDAVRTVVQVQATGAGAVRDLRRQGSLLEEAAPTTRADVLADALIRMKPNDFKAAIGRYADDAQRDVRGQGAMEFAKPEDPTTAFRKAFGEVAQEMLRVAERARDYRATGSPEASRPAADSAAGEAGRESIQSLPIGPGTQAEPSQTRSAEPVGVSTQRTSAPSESLMPTRDSGSAIASTSTPSLKQPARSVNELRKLAVEHEGEVTSAIRDAIRSIPGVEFTKARIKGLAETEQKIVRKHADADTLTDYLGARLTADSPEALDRAIDAVSKRFRLAKHEARLDVPTDWGYRAVHLDMKAPDGFIFEVQIVPKEVAVYQDSEGHPLYEKWRNASELTPAQEAERAADRARSHASYQEAYDRWTGRPSRVAEREEPYQPEGRPPVEEPLPDYDLPPVSMAEVADAGGGRGVARAAGGLMMRLVGGVREPAPSYDVKNPPFFSGLAKAIDQKMPERATPEQIAAIAKGLGIKAEEVKWTGIEDWLAEQTGPVTKAQVQAFLRDNAVKVDEKVLGGRTWQDEADSAGAQAKKDELSAAMFALRGPLARRLADMGVSRLDGENLMLDRSTAISKRIDRGEGFASGVNAPESLVRDLRAYWDSRDAVIEANRQVNALSDVGKPKFEKYTLPGGQNYRELLLTLPARPDQPTFDPAKVEIKRDLRSTTQGSTSIWYDGKRLASYGDDPQMQAGQRNERGEVVYKQRPDDYWMGVAKDLFEKGDSRNSIKSLSGAYRSGHWDEPNVLASVRFNDRVDKDGKKVLFLEEIQSDWHQEGRRKGYAGRGSEAAKEIEALDAKLDALHETGDISRSDSPERAEYDRLMDQRMRFQEVRDQPGTVPPAPFAKTWHELAFKRMLRWAAEHGYDRVAWTTGEQQAERYNLSKHIQNLRWAKNEDGSYYVAGFSGGRQVIEQDRIPEAELDRYVGKDVAGRIVQGVGQVEGMFMGDTNVVSAGNLKGLDLKVGGEGMKGFYDKILPEFAAKYGKKWGAKVGVGTTQIGQGGDFTFRRTSHGDHEVVDSRGVHRGTFDTEAKAKEFVNELRGGRAVETAVHSIDVTPEMRRSVLIEGQTLFSPESPYAASKARARKGATTADRETAQLALFDLEQTAKQPVESVVEKPAKPKKPAPRGEDAGAGVRTVSRMIDEFKDKGFIDFRGQTVREGPEGLRDLAVIGQIARDPRYETFRYFYTKGGEIVGSEAFSSRLPGATNIHEGVQRQPAGGFGTAEVDLEIARRRTDQAKGFAGMRRRMERLGADGYYVMHNHPSGRAEPSREDLNTTEYLASKVPGFKGHIVIDSGEFARIELSDRGHAVATVERLDAQRLDATKAEDPLLRRVGAQKIVSAEDLAQIGRNLKTPENYVSLVHRDGSGAVRAVQEMPVNLFMRETEAQNFIRGQQRAFGASSTFAVFKPTGMTLDQARQYIKQGVLADAIAPGAKAAESALNILQGRGEMPISGTPRDPERDLRTVRVQEPETPYGDFERLKPETRKKLVDFGREVLQDNKTDFASWSKAMREKLGEKSAGTLPGAWSALMQEAARTQAKPARPTEGKGEKPPEPPKDIPRSAGPLDPPPGLTDPQLKLGIHKDVVDAAMELFRAGKIERDPKMLISDQILDAIRDGKLRIEDMAQVLDSRGMTFSDFGAQMFRPAITDAARRLGALGQLQRRLNEIETELTGAAPGRPGGKPGEPDPGKLKTIGDILDAARAIDPAREAKIRNRTLAAALAYWRRADNVRRGLLVTQLATSVRNFTSQVGRLGLDVMDQGLEGGLQRAFGKEVTAHPADSMKAMMDVFRVSPAEAKRRVDALLEGLPREEERLFSNYASDLNRVAKMQGADKVIDAGLRAAEKAVEVLNTFNRFQEYAVRRAVFQAELGARLRRRGIDLEAAIKDPTVRREIPVADIRAAIEKSLEVTFASNPAYGSAGYHFIKWINKTPGATFLIPFPRFMMNALKFYLEFSPAGFLKFLSEAERQKFRQGDMKTMSRGLLGIGLLSAAYLIRSMQADDTKWNEVRLPGMERVIDVRPLNPFASYLFVADILRRAANGNLYGGNLATETIKNILGVNVRGGTGLQAIDQLVDGLRDIGDARALTKYLQGAGGRIVSGLLTPLQQLTDVYAEFDPEAQILRNTRERPFLGPILQRFPSTMVEALGVELPSERSSPTSSEPMKRESPGVRQATGLTMYKAKNDFEKELDRLQIPYREILPSQRDPRLDNLLAAKMGPLAEEEGGRLVNSTRFQNLGEIGKRLELKAYLQRLRKKAKARAMLDREYRDVAREVKAGVSKERLKEMAQEEKAGLR